MKFKICLEHQGSYSSVSSVISSKNLNFYDQNLGSVLAIQFITIQQPFYKSIHLCVKLNITSHQVFELRAYILLIFLKENMYLLCIAKSKGQFIVFTLVNLLADLTLWIIASSLKQLLRLDFKTPYPPGLLPTSIAYRSRSYLLVLCLLTNFLVLLFSRAQSFVLFSLLPSLTL